MPQRDYSHLSAPELVELLKQRDAHAHFGLVWERDAIEKDRHLNDEFVGLELVSDLSHGDGPYKNLVIEGDNFDVLRHLLMTHAGRVNVVYIDPPYNTGSTASNRQGWVYNDKFFDPNSRYRHSTWLEFMYPRLQLACDLLADDGVFMVSIDDTELYNLKLLLDRVFGPKNFVGNIIWNNVTDNNPTRIAVEHEYVLVYTKKKAANAPVWKSSEFGAKTLLIEIGRQLTEKHSDPVELQSAYTEWYRENKSFLGPLSDYKFIDHKGVYAGSRSVHNPGKEGYRYDVPHDVTGRPCKQPLMGYRFPWDTMKSLIDNDQLLYGADENKIVELKVYAKDYLSKLPSVIELDGRKGPNELKAIFGDVLPFNNPKPTELLTQLLTFVAKPGDIILDFFAGSGTTAHAVAKLNAEDGGNRTFIAVSSTEARIDGTEEERQKNICRDVCAQRLRRVLPVENGGTFAYLRARPILRHRLERELTNQVVWNAVSLAHQLPISTLNGTMGWITTAEGVAIAYPTGTKASDVAKFTAAAGEHKGPVICYAWAAPRFAAAVPRAQVFSLPDTLLGNFRKSVALLEDAGPEQVVGGGEEE
ncbi:site-specific DNA-methyltransferase [Aquabacterium sp.]|uniref:site-specific DNA-methyltransferase n=1 Tax=Aquabacterium sp. TaxID=1872578 RepID=UPI00248A1B07|nr:site-specific DNA-methyltransferase [Aquabacterium sp.]MDI1258300.1 site-specific DNA-methyltransferase [Aquabacterium sp.]